MAHVQLSLAVEQPKGLKAMMIIKGGFTNAFTSGVRYGGALEARQWVWALKNAPHELKGPVKSKAMQEANFLKNHYRIYFFFTLKYNSFCTV